MVACRFLGNACIELISEKDHIIIDPVFLSQPKKGIESIFLTHHHPDHTNLDKINDIEKKLLKIKEDDPIDAEKAREVGRELHDAIIEASGNQTLIEFIKSLRSNMDRGCALVGRTDDNIGILLDQHLRIIEAIKEREADKAKKLMKDHLSYARESLLLS